MPFVEDFTLFFQSTEFASDATLAGEAVRGIFDNGYQAFEVASGVYATGPVFLLPSSEVPVDVVGQTLLIGVEAWQVVETEPDGTGTTLLRLRKG
jgi:hypothetical protein